MAAKPAMAKSVISASTPPQITTSAIPRRIHSAASPMAWAPVAQAAATVAMGPRAPK